MKASSAQNLKSSITAMCKTLLLGAPLIAAVAVTPASAQSGADSAVNFRIQEQIRNQQGWDRQFDESARGQTLVNTAEPMFNQASVYNMQRALSQYQQIAARGGWGAVPGNVTLRLGVRHDNVVALRKRLIASGDMDQTYGVSNVFDSYVDAGVRRFQERHGLVPNGVVRKDTIAALNVDVNTRLRQMMANMPRIQSIPADLGDRYVIVNIPAASLEAVQGGRVASRHTAIVGKIDRQTPILSSAIHELNFNPYWTVPVSIIRKDLIPKMKEDPQYLTRNKIRIFEWRGNTELQPTQIDWNTDQATQYRFRQDPGEINSLGTVKINFHNKHQVYLHDTPTKSLFGRDYRFLSSGCVRVQNIRELITWLLEDNQDWSRSRIDTVIRDGDRQDVNLSKRVNIHTVYVTSWATSSGIVHFRDDIYQRDGLPVPVAQQRI